MGDSRRSARAIGALFVSIPMLTGGVLVASSDPGRGLPLELPPVPVPFQNPMTEEKRVLGKMLFWDEQLSSDNTMACGTCHIPSAGGADPTLGLHPGPDGIEGTPDDSRTSFGMIRADVNDDYSPDPVFGLERQSTPRAAPTAIMTMYTFEPFWDGRASTEFRDPVTGDVIIPAGGGLESQALAPPLSDVEMAHEARDWTRIANKLGRVRPMGLATDLPPDMALAIDADPTYPDLFAAAFGDGQITPVRIAFAIATYERTLLPDQTPWDLWIAGDDDAMTPSQVQGWQIFRASQCQTCHEAPLFTNRTFKNIGLRPIADDIGRQAVTGQFGDRGRFKVPTLRNVGLKPSFMHTGEFQLLASVFNFYLGPGSEGTDNRDPLLPIAFSFDDRDRIIDFLANGLTDPRVANEEFPFDRPTLNSEGAPNPTLLGGAAPGQGGFAPRMIAAAPPNVGNTGFKIGLDRALGGSTASVVLSETPPVGGVLTPDVTIGPIVVEGLGAGGGYATLRYALPANSFLEGRTLYAQWLVDDASGPGGVARSDVARLDLFCAGGCPEDCAADVAEPFGQLDFNDVTRFLEAFGAGELVADIDLPASSYDFADVVGFLTAFASGCP